MEVTHITTLIVKVTECHLIQTGQRMGNPIMFPQGKENQNFCDQSWWLSQLLPQYVWALSKEVTSISLAQMSVGLFSLCCKFCISEISQDFIFSLILPAIITLGNPKVTISFAWHFNIYLNIWPLSKAPVLDFQLPTSWQTWQAKNHDCIIFIPPLNLILPLSLHSFVLFCFVSFLKSISPQPIE